MPRPQRSKWPGRARKHRCFLLVELILRSRLLPGQCSLVIFYRQSRIIQAAIQLFTRYGLELRDTFPLNLFCNHRRWNTVCISVGVSETVSGGLFLLAGSRFLGRRPSHIEIFSGRFHDYRPCSLVASFITRFDVEIVLR